MIFELHGQIRAYIERCLRASNYETMSALARAAGLKESTLNRFMDTASGKKKATPTTTTLMSLHALTGVPLFVWQGSVQTLVTPPVPMPFIGASVGLCHLDTQLKYLTINRWLAQINGMSIDAHLGQSMSDLLPDLASNLAPQLKHVLETGQSIVEGKVQAEIPSTPGVLRTFKHHFDPVFGHNNLITGVTCVVAELAT